MNEPDAEVQRFEWDALIVAVHPFFIGLHHGEREDSISLDVKLVQLKKDYKLDLALIDNKMEGNYELYESQTLAEDGNATASRSAS